MIRVGVLTFNALSTLRDELVLRTMASIERTFPSAYAEWHVLDNGSTDHSAEALAHYTKGWHYHRYRGGGHTTPGAGRNRLVRAMEPRDRDLIVLSDDDMLWRPGAALAVEELWEHAPADLVLASGLLEPVYPWSEPQGRVTIGDGLQAVQRPTVPAAAWTFPAPNWGLFGPLKESLHGDGEDVDACKRIASAGGRVVALDLAEHIGEGYSQLGNDQARKLVGKPINKKEWGL